MWSTEKHILLLNELARLKPVGIHKHFRLLEISNELQISLSELKEQISIFYDLEQLEGPNDSLFINGARLEFEEFQFEDVKRRRSSVRRRR